MKKLALILAMLLVIPGAAFGLEMLNDSALDNVTGQSGVNIVFDDIEMFINIDKMSYVDTDGFASEHFIGTNAATTSALGGALSIVDFQIDTLKINAIATGSDNGITWDLYSASAGNIPLQFAYGDTTSLHAVGSYFAGTRVGLENYTSWNPMVAGGYAAKAVTIDVTSALPVTSECFAANTGMPVMIGGVLIGLPTAEFYIPEMVFVPTFTTLLDPAGAGAAVFNSGDDFGTIIIEGITFSVLNGWLEISPH